MLEAVEQAEENFEFQASEHDVIFDYFATEIFQRAEPELQTFMVSTSLLPQFSVVTARSLTGNKNASQILQELARRNYFTMALQGETTLYQYHPLFRQYLLEQTQHYFSVSQLRALQKKRLPFWFMMVTWKMPYPY